ncbi:MAG: adaptor protein MecA [Ruminococcaceae bacterium]|nr:adaptor protein MecA [Oscillospiraceae bacterium]
MELILISESKLKIMLTADDMENYSISNEYLSYEKKETRRVFEKLLDEAREKTGFNSTSDRIFIQVYPSKNGGCEVYVTLNCDEKENDGKIDKRTKDKSPNVRNKRENCLYSFENIDDAISACCILKRNGYRNESSFYSDKSDSATVRYYLLLQEEVVQNQQGRKRKSVSKSDLANEFGKRLSSKEWLLYIKERADVIVGKNAVDVIGALG